MRCDVMRCDDMYKGLGSVAIIFELFFLHFYGVFYLVSDQASMLSSMSTIPYARSITKKPSLTIVFNH
jgi:hypothetical protein